MSKRHRLGFTGLFTRDVWMIFIANALGNAAFLGVRDLLSPLYWLRLGFGADMVGTVFATGALSFCVSSLPGGALGTRLGARRTMLLGVIIGAIGQAMLPAALAIPASWRMPWLLASQVIATSGWSFFVVNTVAALAALTTPANRQAAYAMNEVGSGIGMFTGSLGGSMLPGLVARLAKIPMEQPAPYGHAIWGAALLCLAMLLPLVRISRTPVAHQAGAGHARLRLGLPILLLIVAGYFNQATYAAPKAFASAYMDSVLQMPTPLIGTVTSLAMVASIFGSLTSSRLARRYGATRTLRAASAGMALCLLLLVLSRQGILVAAGIIGALGLVGLWRPVFLNLQMEFAAPQWRALLSGITSMGMSLGFASMSYGGGQIVAWAGYRWLYVAGAATAAMGILIASALGRQSPYPTSDSASPGAGPSEAGHSVDGPAPAAP